MTSPNPTNFLYVGLTGRMASGKGEVVRMLGEWGFVYLSLSDMVREEVRRLGREVNRSEMQDIGNRLRQEGGAGVLGVKIRERIEADPFHHFAIDGVRNPAEVMELRRLRGFKLLAIDADVNLLLDRMASRGRGTDCAPPEQLQARLDREWGIGEPPEGQQVGACVALADERILNNGGLSELQERLIQVMGKWGWNP